MHCAMKAYGGVKGVAPPFLTQALDDTYHHENHFYVDLIYLRLHRLTHIEARNLNAGMQLVFFFLLDFLPSFFHLVINFLCVLSYSPVFSFIHFIYIQVIQIQV
jgi:hypothetical protein